MTQFNDPVASAPQAQFTEQMIREKIENLKTEQHFALGIMGGFFGGVIGAALWAVISVLTNYQIGYMAIAVGFLVGMGVRVLGKGIDKRFAVMGAILAFVAVVLGNFLTDLAFLAKAWEVSFLEAVLTFKYSMTFTLLIKTFSAIDILFYLLAIAVGYRTSRRKVSREDLLNDNIQTVNYS